MKEMVIGVIYQTNNSLENYRERLREVDRHSTCIVDSNRKMVIESRFPETNGAVYKRVYSFHQLVYRTDAYKLSGLQFTGFWFCDGTYNVDTLNYLQSRVRG